MTAFHFFKIGSDYFLSAMLTNENPEPFVADKPSPKFIENLRFHLETFSLPHIRQKGWQDGCPASTVISFAEYWKNEFNFDKWHSNLFRYAHYKLFITGLDVCFVHIRSKNIDTARPLILIHGWPGSVLEFWDSINLLTNDFHIVIPHLPGFGFSSVPPKEYGIFEYANTFNILMETLGYDEYIAQGGGWGSMIARGKCETKNSRNGN